MLRRILAPLAPADAGGAPAAAAPAAVYRREPAKDVAVGAPEGFRLRAHVACDPRTGLYSGMDEFLTLAVSSKGAPPSLGGAPPRADDPPFPRLAALPPRPPHAAAAASGSPAKKRSPRRAAAAAASRALFARPGLPVGVMHAVHVRVDPAHPTGFAGLPPAWETVLLGSGIGRGEALMHPQEVVDVLNFSKAGVEEPVRGAAAARFSFPRTPTVTSFDDASDFTTHVSEPSPRAPAAAPPVPVPDLVLEEPVEKEKGVGNAGALDTVELSRVLDFGESEVVERLEKENGGPHAAAEVQLSSANAKANALPKPVRARAKSGGREAARTFEETEDEMQKVIGGDRVAFRPDCLPSDALGFEIRQGDLHAIFSSITKIGEGSSGSVYSANRRVGGAPVAIKQVKPANDRDWALYRYEVHVMKSHADQSNLVSCYDAFRDGDHLFMVLELMQWSLANVLEHRRADAFGRALSSPPDVALKRESVEEPAVEDGRSRIPQRKKSRGSSLAMAAGCEEELVAYVAREVLQGLQHLHRIGRVHRDIKSDNVLVKEDGSVKVADFGFCAELSGGKRNTVVGTPFQMAPEVIRGKDYGTPVDIWSVGILAYELAEGAPPHEGLPPIRAMFLIATSEPPSLGEEWSADLRDFVSSCCTLDASRRPTAAQALNHPFIARACSKELAGQTFEVSSAAD